jgi:hypothetical protein
MKPSLLLKIASVLTFLHAVGHTIGGVLGKPRNGAEEIAVIETMKAHSFNVMGSMKTYWDFLFGYGLDASVTMLVTAVVFWQLATIAKSNSSLVRPIILVLGLQFLITAAIAWRYFFIAPAVMEIVIAICAIWAFLVAGPRAEA